MAGNPLSAPPTMYGQVTDYAPRTTGNPLIPTIGLPYGVNPLLALLAAASNGGGNTLASDAFAPTRAGRGSDAPVVDAFAPTTAGYGSYTPNGVDQGSPAQPVSGQMYYASGGADPNAGYGGTAYGGGGINLSGAMPTTQSIASALGVDPGAIGAGFQTAIGLMGPVGMALGAVNAVGNVANTVNDTGMLGNLGVSPGIGQQIGGALGFNSLAGGPTSSLNMAMNDQMPGYQGIEVGQYNGPMAAMTDTVGTAPVGAVSQQDLGPPGTSDPNAMGYGGDPSGGYGGVDASTGDMSQGMSGMAGPGGGDNSGASASGGGDMSGNSDGSSSGGGSSGDSSSGGSSGQGGDNGFWKGGKVDQNKLMGPAPTNGHDTGYAPLQAGEYVVRALAAKRYGDILKQINAGTYKPGR